MAEQAEIQQARNLLGDSSEESLTNEEIDELLDSGKTPDQIAAYWWDMYASKTASIVDISESGSSRSLSQIHKNAVAMAAKFADKIAEPTVPETTTRTMRSITLKRV